MWVAVEVQTEVGCGNGGHSDFNTVELRMAVVSADSESKWQRLGVMVRYTSGNLERVIDPVEQMSVLWQYAYGYGLGEM